jgi:alpha-tubulin suppressor-like RCC1 family protein
MKNFWNSLHKFSRRDFMRLLGGLSISILFFKTRKLTATIRAALNVRSRFNASKNCSMWGWGWNHKGQLGLGDTNNRSSPVQIGGLANWVNVVGGYAHAMALRSDGTIWSWGYNLRGQLGNNETTDRSQPVQTGTATSWVALAAGNYSSFGLKSDGTLWSWGSNTNGRLGLGDTNNRGDDANEMGDNLPTVDLGTGRSALDLSIGRNFTCALLDNSTVKCWGDNFLGMLGRGDTNQVGDLPNQMGDNLAPIDLGTGRTAKFIASRGIHSCAILDNDSLKCWGANSNKIISPTFYRAVIEQCASKVATNG